MLYYILIPIIVLIVLTLSITFYKIYTKKSLEKKGLLASHTVGKILKRFAMIYSYKVLTNVKINDELTADHILVGFFGILIVNSYSINGEVYTATLEKEWAVIENDKKSYINNPLMTSKACVDGVKKILATKKLYKTSCDFAVVFLKRKKLNLYARDTLPVMDTKGFKKFLKDIKFTKDNDVDVEEICKLLSPNSTK